MVPLFTLLLHALYLTTSKHLTFDDYGDLYIRTRIESKQQLNYSFSLQSNEYIYIMASTSSNINYQLIHSNTNTSFEHQYDISEKPYYLLHLENTAIICSYSDKRTNCTFNLILTNTGVSWRPIWIKFNKNIVIKPNDIYSNKITFRNKRRYAMQINSNQNQLPMLIKLTTTETNDNIDAEIFGYFAANFDSSYYPRTLDMDHIFNSAKSKQLLITSMPMNEWIFFEIESYKDMEYQFEVITNYKATECNTMRFVMTIMYYIMILLVYFCYFWEQIFCCCNRFNLCEKRNKIIDKLKVVYYEIDLFDFAKCSICLEDYILNDKVRILNCNHNFHVHCSDQWLKISNKCPLCKQNINKAQNIHGENIFDLNIIKTD